MPDRVRPALRAYLRVASRGRSVAILVCNINVTTKKTRFAASPTRRTPDCPPNSQTSTRSNPRSRTLPLAVCAEYAHVLTTTQTASYVSSSSTFLTFSTSSSSSSRSYIFHLLFLLLASSISFFLRFLPPSFPPPYPPPPPPHILTPSFFSSPFLSLSSHLFSHFLPSPSPLSSHSLSAPSLLSSHFTVTFTKHVRSPPGVSARGSY